MDLKQLFGSAVFTFVALVGLVFGGMAGFVAYPLLHSIDGLGAVDSKEPICFQVTMQEAYSKRLLNCWMSAEWNHRRESWRVVSVSTVRPEGRRVSALSTAIDQGLTAENKYFRVYDGTGRFLGWYCVPADQTGVGIDVPVGAKPHGQAPAGQAPKGSIGQKPPDA